MQRMRSRPAPLSIPRILGEAARVLLSIVRVESEPRVSQEQQRGRGFGSLGYETRPQERMGFELASEGCGDGAQNTRIPLLYFWSALEAETKWLGVHAHSCTKQRAGRYDGVRSRAPFDRARCRVHASGYVFAEIPPFRGDLQEGCEYDGR